MEVQSDSDDGYGPGQTLDSDVCSDSDGELMDVEAAEDATAKAEKEKCELEERTRKRQKHLDNLDQADHGRDRLLQQLLWDIGAHWMIKPHQFLAIRKVAGVPDNWPLQLPPGDTPAYPAQRGILLGDDMGSGKTISTLAGTAVRDWLNAQNGVERLPTLVIAPNAAVAAQWKKEFSYKGELAGMGEEPAVVYTDGPGARQQLEQQLGGLLALDEEQRPRLIIATRRQAQDMMHGAPAHRHH